MGRFRRKVPWMRYLAIDYGAQRSGLAVCDAQETITSPLCVLHGQKRLAERIAEIAKTEGVGAVVLGLPLNMDGSEGPQVQRVRTFAAKLGPCIQIPIHFQDERLSSFASAEKLAEADLSRTARRDRLDAVAAADILESFLERTRSQAQR